MLMLLRAEFAKLFRRRGTYVGYAVLLVLVLAVAVPIRCYSSNVEQSLMDDAQRSGIASAMTDRALTGLFVPRVMLFLPLRIMVVNTLMGFFAAIVGGGMISGEYAAGTLRLMLTRPPARWRLALAKFGAAAVQSASLPLFLGLSALAVGYALFGSGPMLFLDVGEGPRGVAQPALFFAEREALIRLALCYGLMALGAVSVASMGLFLSSFTAHALTAAGVTFGAVLLCGVLSMLGSVPEEIGFFAFFRTIHPYLITTHINVYDAPLMADIDWERVWTSVAWLLGYSTAFLGGALLIFSRRDVRC